MIPQGYFTHPRRQICKHLQQLFLSFKIHLRKYLSKKSIKNSSAVTSNPFLTNFYKCQIGTNSARSGKKKLHVLGANGRTLTPTPKVIPLVERA